MLTARARYRERTAYHRINAKLQKELVAYADTKFAKKYGREYYLAGSSPLLPRQRMERSWVFGEERNRAGKRAEIIALARKLDDIDKVCAYDSAQDYDGRGAGPPAGDNHFNRAWRHILISDTIQLEHIISRRGMGWKKWTRRLLVRALIPLAVAIVGIVLWAAHDQPAWSVAAWGMTILNTPIIWRRMTQRDGFIMAVADIRTEHQDALIDLTGRLKRGDHDGRAFNRSPHAQPLIDLLLRQTT